MPAKCVYFEDSLHIKMGNSYINPPVLQYRGKSPATRSIRACDVAGIAFVFLVEKIKLYISQEDLIRLKEGRIGKGLNTQAVH